MGVGPRYGLSWARLISFRMRRTNRITLFLPSFRCKIIPKLSSTYDQTRYRVSREREDHRSDRLQLAKFRYHALRVFLSRKVVFQSKKRGTRAARTNESLIESRKYAGKL